jgi:hypothetical protein
MLPHSVAQDVADALEHLSALAFGLNCERFKPHLEFRCPRIGEIMLRGATLELRQPVEPWHALVGVGLDATSDLLAGEGHILVAATPDPQSAAPVSRLGDPCKMTFEFDTKLTHVRETPRETSLTRPRSGRTFCRQARRRTALCRHQTSA